MNKYEVYFIEIKTGRKGRINVYGDSIEEAENTFKKIYI